MFGGRKIGQQCDLATRGHALCRRDARIVFECDFLRSDELDQSLQIIPRIAGKD